MSRTVRSQSLRRRSSRSVPATILASLLVALSAVAAWAGITRLVTGTWPGFLGPVRRMISEQSWNSPALMVTAIALALVGLALLVTAVGPGQHTALRLSTAGGADPGTAETVISRRGLARIASAHLDQADGVDSASARARTGKVTVLVRTPLHDTTGFRERLTRSLERRFEQIGLDPAPRVVVQVRSTP